MDFELSGEQQMLRDSTERMNGYRLPVAGVPAIS
jgi:hypothetical protein